MNRFLQKIVGLGLARMLMEMLLPAGDARRYADLGTGLCMTLCMLQSLLAFLRRLP